MSAELVHDVWVELRHYLNSLDVQSAADGIVSILVDNDIDAEEIKEAFKGDAEIKKALVGYLDQEIVDDEEFGDEPDYDPDSE